MSKKETLETSDKFDVKKIQTQHTRGAILQKNDKIKNHLQSGMWINDIQRSYDVSIAGIDKKDPDYKEKIKHIQSVLSAGPINL